MDKLITFTDIHYGLKRNSLDHNKDCDEFIDWVIEKAKKEKIKKCAFLGDWHHNRHTINVETLKYSFMGMEKLNSYFDEVYFIVGNHDMYYREHRDVHSVSFADGLDSFVVVNKRVDIGDMAFLPWLVEDEWKEVKNIKQKYIFGHFELPTFYLNSMIKMPKHDNMLESSHFNKNTTVFSGHFHKRQNEGNVWYIGNAFPHTFDDVDDEESRGVMVLDDTGIKFDHWPNSPRYKKFKYEDLKGNEDTVLDGMTKIHAKIYYNSKNVSGVQINLYREFLKENYPFRTIDLLDTAETLINESEDGETPVEETEEVTIISDIDSVTINQLNKIESEEFDKDLLIRLYKEL